MTGPVRREIRHVSRYFYPRPVRDSVMSLCMKPRDDATQKLLEFRVQTEPAALISEGTDCFGNAKHVLNIHFAHRSVEIVARSTVEKRPPAPLPPSLGAAAWDEMRSWRDSFALWDFTHSSPFTRPSPALDAFASEVGVRPGDDPLESLLRLSDILHDSFQYTPGVTSAQSTIEHILASRRGVCQDYSHVMIALARRWGAPARYVSGYLYVEGREDEQAPSTATHAWVECLLPDLGWVGFDPTNRVLADHRHVAIAVGRDHTDTTPVWGIFRGGEESRLEVEVRVR